MVVIGGGVAGLAAAWELSERLENGASPGGGAEIVVLESSDRVGGKLRSEELCGTRIDVGAEAMLNRRPEGVALARAAGLEVVHPSGAQSHLWTGEAVVPLPRTLMGVPLDVPALAASGVLSEATMRRIEREPSLPPLKVEGDLSVGDLVAARFGDEVTDVLVEPLLGGVYAGHAREISAQCAAPQLLTLASQGSMLEAAAGATATAQGSAAVPVFAAVRGGMHRLPAALAASGRFTVHTDAAVESLEALAPTEGPRFRLAVDLAGDHIELLADAVIVATPAHVAAHLLAQVAPEVAAQLNVFEAASVGVISFAFDADRALDTSQVGERGSGFLVPPSAGRGIKAATFSFAKWDQVREAGRGKGPEGQDVLFLRASVARLREDDVLRLRDDDLAQVARDELEAAVGLQIEPLGSHVQRWWAGLPQYPVGHRSRVERIRRQVAGVPGLAVAGAAYDGVGIPATIASAQRAVADLLTGTMEP